MRRGRDAGRDGVGEGRRIPWNSWFAMDGGRAGERERGRAATYSSGAARDSQGPCGRQRA
ncbi:hypothetical protein VFPFJ_08647 [Purpureocillium lilacinum]|uniref:Uncharacterized protein n=1 Tax=Purpureocillium lilacinum TaxID=33203 RepID=A0A179GY82_PURLI|nr:hypothetical protein VFPFJ_08647 [Purpureocillium lilacinum]OAQ82844.1 hypothetical protein VFPFJ_08647 [Purpureocillium lilacinum]